MRRRRLYLLEKALEARKELGERKRKDTLIALSRALQKLSRMVRFDEVYVFGSLAKPYRYSDRSDVDVAFVGLRDEDFFTAMAFLSQELETDVDVVQLEASPLNERIRKEGILIWKGGA